MSEDFGNKQIVATDVGAGSSSDPQAEKRQVPQYLLHKWIVYLIDGGEEIPFVPLAIVDATSAEEAIQHSLVAGVFGFGGPANAYARRLTLGFDEWEEGKKIECIKCGGKKKSHNNALCPKCLVSVFCLYIEWMRLIPG